MAKILLFTNVFFDGVGDFSHLLEILTALKSDPRFAGDEFVIIIENHHPHLTESMSRKLDELGVRYYFKNIIAEKTLSDSDFLNSEELKAATRDVDNLIGVSYIGGSSIIDLIRAANPRATARTMLEHEREEAKIGKLSCSLGLRENAWGMKFIKGEGATRLPLEGGLTQIEEKSPEFVAKLLSSTSTKSISDFANKSVIIPVYSSTTPHVARSLIDISCFLRNTGKNNICIYLSGKDLIKGVRPSGVSLQSYFTGRSAPDGRIWIPKFASTALTHFKKSNINKIIIHEKGSEVPLIQQCNEKGTHTIHIYYKYALSDPEYDILYRAAPLAAPSGDNTLEKTISMGCFPLYCPTHPETKYLTMEGLIRIIKRLIPDEQLQDTYSSYFTLLPGFLENTLTPEQYEKFISLDRDSMLDTGPKISKHLVKFYNFNDVLGNLVLAQTQEELDLLKTQRRSAEEKAFAEMKEDKEAKIERKEEIREETKESKEEKISHHSGLSLFLKEKSIPIVEKKSPKHGP